MKNSTFSAQVANNLLTVLQGYSKTIRLLLVILTMFVLSIGQMYGYTITFNGSADESTSLSTSTTAASITGNSTYVTGNLVTATKVYGATSNGVKLGASSNAGTIKFNLSTTGQVTPTSIVVNCKLYNSSKSATLKVNGSATQNVPSSSGNLTFAITSPITYIELVSNKYIWIKSVTVNTAAGSTTYKVTYDKNGATSGSVPTDATSYNSGATVTVKSNSGNLAKTGYTFGGWNTKSDGTGTNYTAGSGTFTITANTTLYAKWNTATKYTVTFDAGSGTCDDESLTETSGGAGVTLPTANPPATCATNGWKFAGWWTGSVAETTTSPGELLTAGSNYKPTTNCTLYAVYSHTEAGGSGGSSEITLLPSSFPEKGSNNYGSGAERTATENDIEFGGHHITGNALNTPSGATQNQYLQCRANDATIYNKTELPGKITQIVVNQYDAKAFSLYCGSTQLMASDNVDRTQTPSGTKITDVSAATTMTWDVDGNYTFFALKKGSNAGYVQSIIITYSGGGSTTTYNSNPDCGGVDPEPTGYTITFEANNGTKIDKIENATALPDPLPTTTRDHYTFAGWFTDEDCTQAATAGAEINANTTLYAKWTPITYTITFDAGSGTCATEPTQGNFEAGITLPTATPCTYAQENGWRFVGWSETTVSETTVRPAIHTGNYRPTKDIKLHAVYAKTGTAEGAAGEFILSLEYKGTTYYVGQTFDNNKLSAETEQTNAARFTIEDNYLHYEGGYISHVATTSSPNITKQADKANAKAWTITEEAYTVIFTSTADNTRGLGFNYNSGSPRFAAYQLSNDDYPHTFTKTSVSGGNVQVTTYNSKPSCEAPVDPNWVAATITHTAIKANCGSTTVLGSEGENGPATISFSGTDLQNSVTVTASDGFLVSTDKKAPEKYAKSVIIYPNSTGSNIGKITQNVHVIANATAKNESYTGTITLTGNDIPGGEQVIDVTAAVTCTQYTITWSVNGDDSHQVTYSPGDALQLPSISVTPCDGMEHVGWTDNMGYDHGTDILFTETTDMTVTSDKTYYAVFATPTSSVGGETTLDFSEQGYANQATVNSLTIDAVTVTFDIGTNSNSNPPKYYTSGEAVRAYGGNTFTVSSGNTIYKIVITFGSSDGTNEITTDSGDYSDGTWTGSANEITFTIGGSSGNRRIASITVTSAGGGASYYTDYTTTCEGRQLETPTNLQATDITYNGATLTWDAVAGANKYKVVINGTEYISNTNSYTTHDLKQQIAYTWTVQAIGNGTTFTDSEISAEATFTTGAELIITWSVSTATSTTTITKGQPIGANLKTPATPAACEGKYFMGWSASSTVNSDGSDFTPITSDIIPETNVTYYAVFAKPTSDGNNVGDLFHESFDTMNGKGGNDGTWNGISSSTDAQIDGWSFTKGYVANQCIRLGTGEVAGSATTPALDINGNATLTFDAGAWNGNSEKLIINLTIVGDGSIEPSSVTLTKGQFNTYTANITGANADTKVQFIAANAANNRFFLDEVKVSGGSSDSYTDYSTSCGTYTVTFYGFNSGGYTTTCNGNPAVDEVEQGGTYVIPNCEPTFDPAELGRTFAGTWNTQANGKGTAYKPGDEIVNVRNDITLYAQWALNTSENTTLPTDVEDLATTDIIVTGGTTLTLQTGTTTINSLTLKGGLQENGTYAMPVVNIPTGAALVRNNNKINLDLKVNNNSYYPFAVPFEVQNIKANIHYLDEYLNSAATYGTHYQVLTYDGALRAENGLSNDNWVEVGRHTAQKPSYLVPGKGYAISAVPAKGETTTTIRISMDVDDDWFAGGEQISLDIITRNAVEVVAHKGTAATEHPRHAGWNFVANPYLSKFAGTYASNEGGSFINGEILIDKGEYSYSDDKVPYVTIPTYDFAHYNQVRLSEATLSPAYSFFVQVGKSGTMTFETAGRQQAPASIAARNAEERPVKMDVDITLSDNHSSDQTGIIISDRYSDSYEIGRDLEKLFGSAYNLSVYTLMADNTPLAFQALAIRSNMQVIPVGYRAPEQGEYTFRLNEATSSIDLLNEQYEQLVLVDYQTGELTNLLISDYTFYSERTQADNRFAIYAVPRQNTPTDLPNAIGQDKQAQKIIHNGHLYILRDGNVYNGNGQIVK